MTVESINPDNTTTILSSVDHFDFNWHINYVYGNDVALLPTDTERIHCRPPRTRPPISAMVTTRPVLRRHNGRASGVLPGNFATSYRIRLACEMLRGLLLNQFELKTHAETAKSPCMRSLSAAGSLR